MLKIPEDWSSTIKCYIKSNKKPHIYQWSSKIMMELRIPIALDIIIFVQEMHDSCVFCHVGGHVKHSICNYVCYIILNKATKHKCYCIAFLITYNFYQF